MRWVDGLERMAADRLTEPVGRYFRQGSDLELSVREAGEAWDALRLLPHVLRDVSTVSTATSVLGADVATPVLVAPTTLQRQADPDGEVAMARGVAAADGLVCVSSNAGMPFGRLPETGARWWVQAYVTHDRALTVDMLAVAKEHGASAVVLTADTPVVGRRLDGGPSVWDTVPAEHLLVNVTRDGVQVHALDKAADLTPDAIGWLHDVSGLPVVVKGVLRADDARECVTAGASAIWVSNHGGRQLDGVVPTARALPRVADAVAGTGAEVYVDGGIRHGRHVFAALALGARAVFVGRPTLWALAVDGADGVRRLLDDLTGELAHTMMLAGTPALSDVTADLVE